MSTRARPRELPAPVFDTKVEFAARAHISLRTLNRQIDQGLPVIRIGGAVRIDPYDGLRFLKEGRTLPLPPRRGRPRKAAIA
jgi:hypothetical protein